MPARTKGGAPPKRQHHAKAEAKSLKRKREQQDIQKLQAAADEFDPKNSPVKNFTDLPLSEPTSSGLRASHFEELTDIQARAVPLALKGKDILGAAKTGSGKTLAFIIPVLEKLFRAQWTEYDGLGALIISPTRELAVQIFEVLRKVGRNHTFSAGLVIGGKSLQEEAQRLGRMNILVCTPGRMLQHLDQTAGFDVDNLQILVLDEADRIMDMGFQSAVDALVDHLPKERQTLLFSATQSKRVSDLARLSLKDPEYVSVHEAADSATPSTLQQHYIVTPLHEKLDTLYGFIRSNLKSKIIVFFSSGKQVRFVYETFRQLQPGIPLLHLHGRQKQLARLEITKRYTTARHACLFATDVVARGVDFPAVDWVIQADCPEDADTYIHRVGRTARYQSNGRAVLFLDPSEEEGMLKRLEQKKVTVQKVNVKENRKKSIMNQLQSMCWKQHDIKYLGQKAFISYTRSVHLQRDKEVFKLDKLDLDAFAASLGLPGTPQIKFQKGEDIKKLKNASRAAMSSGSESDADEEGGKKKKKDEVRTKAQKMFERQNQDVLSSHYKKLIGDEGNADDEEADFFSAKRVLNDKELDEAAKTRADTGTKVIDFGGDQQLIIDSKRREKLLKSKKQLLKFKGHGQKLVFDDDGNAHPIYELIDEEQFKQQGPVEELRQRFVDMESGRVKEADVEDKQLAKQKRREKRDKRKAREAEERGLARPQTTSQLEGADEGEDPLALLRSLPVGDEEEDSDREDERPRKKAKKWFQNDSDVEDAAPKKKGKKKVIEVTEEPDTLEDLEALATGLLDD
ncbi:putative atp-dependent rna helicase dbp4 protein [Phaeoacremonium minimum UCRPA7]|uniref:ATP-dependent RNA helicase n=1 Tax=Phaeoacremonium minimum (strain UCR-PA7) TaxID=1286976 RepID=R8BPB2_PHAM7|nr:putative atp-dependent rna helicase dbp4 protein [Phaeoacremonium minimum UCRPA7]EOO01176.1 putative atp-dependent rna helicase dbp4 protein [Phaeoacremonium minimum UCRPA7]